MGAWHPLSVPHNFKTECLLHTFSHSDTVPGCSPFAVSVPCVDFFFSDDMFSVLMASELACSCGPVYSAECWSLEKSQFRAFGKGKAFCPW